MKLSRRNFAKVLGLAPLAAKVAADAEIVKLTNGQNPVAHALNAGYGLIPSAQAGPMDYNQMRVAAALHAKTVGIPDFVKEQMRRSSQYIGCMDPDLAAKKSWSMSVKILTQRERNLERHIEAIQYSAMQAQGATVFRELTGFDWPW